MPIWRVTVRHGRPQQYAMHDIEADTLAAALRLAAERIAETEDATADLAEIRVQADPGGRQYVEG